MEAQGGTPLYKLYVYRYVPPQRVWFLSHFGLKTGAYKRIILSFQLHMKVEKEKYPKYIIRY